MRSFKPVLRMSEFKKNYVWNLGGEDTRPKISNTKFVKVQIFKHLKISHFPLGHIMDKPDWVVMIVVWVSPTPARDMVCYEWMNKLNYWEEHTKNCCSFCFVLIRFHHHQMIYFHIQFLHSLAHWIFSAICMLRFRVFE